MTCLFFSSVFDRVDYKEVRGFSGIVFLKLPFTMEPVIKASNEWSDFLKTGVEMLQ